MGEAAREEKRRSIKLFCPSVSKIVQYIEREDQRVDLGFIARVFGLDPNTLKLNGHFISRGVDYIASSVTWKSLIGFFSARGLSTGGTDSDPLLVHGKLSRNASKREHEHVDADNGILAANQQGSGRNSKRPQLEYTKILKKDSTEIKSGPVDFSNQMAWCNGPNGLDLKRKLWLEDDSHLKRSRTYEAFPDDDKDFGGSHCLPRILAYIFASASKTLHQEVQQTSALQLYGKIYERQTRNGQNTLSQLFTGHYA